MRLGDEEGGRALEQQSGDMTAQSVVARNGGHRGGGMKGQSPNANKRGEGERVGGGRRWRPPWVAA